MFNTVAQALEYSEKACNAFAHFAGVVQKYTGVILERNCNGYRLLVC
jgi:hypothetical protein